MARIISDELYKRDDPIFSVGAQRFSMRRPKPSSDSIPTDTTGVKPEKSPASEKKKTPK